MFVKWPFWSIYFPNFIRVISTLLSSTKFHFTIFFILLSYLKFNFSVVLILLLVKLLYFLFIDSHLRASWNSQFITLNFFLSHFFNLKLCFTPKFVFVYNKKKKKIVQNEKWERGPIICYLTRGWETPRPKSQLDNEIMKEIESLPPQSFPTLSLPLSSLKPH